MPKEILLCPPTQYEVVYTINPWMDPSIPVDPDKALREYAELKQAYVSLGANIHEIEQEAGLPDMIYAANYGSVHRYDETKKQATGKNGLFIKANFMHDERKGEAELAKNFFTEAGFDIAELPKDINWEGQGDFLKAGDIYVLGHGQRSDIRAKGPLAEILGVPESRILDLQMMTDSYYHVDTAFAPLDPTTVVINQKAFGKEDLQKIRTNFRDVIETNDQDNSVLGCNLVVVEKTIVVGKGISQELKDKFSERGFTTTEIPMTESLKGGGSVKCNTLEYY